MSDNITLLGFSGAGKSVLGRKLAQLSGKTFFDLDEEIENYYKTSIPIIFSKYGEDVFRKCEQKLLAQMLQCDDFILAVGGGCPCFGNSMQLINEFSTSIYLKLSEKVLFDNLRNSNKRRPLTDNKSDEELRNYIRTTLQKRENFYNQAKIVIESESGNFDAANVIDILGIRG